MIKNKILRCCLFFVVALSILVIVFVLNHRKQIDLIVQTKEIIVSAYDTYGVLPDKFNGMISSDLFEKICFRSKPKIDKANITENYQLSDWCVDIIDDKATVKYTYTYSQREKNTGNPLTGSLCIPCEICYECVDGIWIAVLYKEPL